MIESLIRIKNLYLLSYDLSAFAYNLKAIQKTALINIYFLLFMVF